ncbi:DNA-binding FrmR family transcriptional regulator [Rhodococcus sp. 27YEA15]
MLDGMSSYSPEQDDLLKRLRRIEGQVAGISRMVADDRYCIDVLTQVSAATSALQSVSLKLLDAHLAGCVVEAAKQGGPEADVKIKEAQAAIARLVRS